MTNIKDVLKDLRVLEDGKQVDDRYIIKLSSSDDFAYYNSLLDTCIDLDIISDKILFNEEAVVLMYNYKDEYVVKLVTNYVEDTYNLIIIAKGSPNAYSYDLDIKE